MRVRVRRPELVSKRFVARHEIAFVAVENFLLPPYSQVNLQLGAVNGGINGEGYLENSFINFQVGPESSPGDTNCDGSIHALHIEPFLGLLFP